MGTNYEKIVEENLLKLFSEIPPDFDKSIGGEKSGEGFSFRAFGEDCRISPAGITLGAKQCVDPRGLLISLYALHPTHGPIQLEPFKSFKELPGSMPYQGAFSANSERVLVPCTEPIKENQEGIIEVFDGEDGHEGDLSFILYPLPKIALYYIFYLGDEDFPPSATCLFSANAVSFMPLAGLADVAEYTSKGIIKFIS